MFVIVLFLGGRNLRGHCFYLFFFLVLETEPMALNILSKLSITELQNQPIKIKIKKTFLKQIFKVSLRLALNTRSSCLSLLNARIEHVPPGWALGLTSKEYE